MSGNLEGNNNTDNNEIVTADISFNQQLANEETQPQAQENNDRALIESSPKKQSRQHHV